MSKMMARVKLFAVLGCVHVLTYSLPRLLHTLLVKLPVSLFELITFKKKLTYFHEREIKVVASGKLAGEDAKQKGSANPLLAQLGLNRPLRYTGPLYNGHVQTIFSAGRPSRRIEYTRELVRSDDDNDACMDWLYADEATAKGVLLINPGFGNYSQTPYIQRIVRSAVRHGLHCCVHTMRAIGSAPLSEERKHKIGSAILTSDIRAVVRGPLQPAHIKERFGRALPVGAIGFSAGATLLYKLVQEEEAAYAADPSIYPDGLSIQLLINVCSPFDLELRSVMMQSFIGKRMYQSAMVAAIWRITHKHKDKITYIENVPELNDPATMDEYIERASKSMEAYEELLISRYNGYPSVKDYYDACNCFPMIDGIHKTTTVCLTPKDDPITGYIAIEKWKEITAKQSNIVYVETSTGGHMGYLLGPWDEAAGKDGFMFTFPIECFIHYFSALSKSK